MSCSALRVGIGGIVADLRPLPAGPDRDLRGLVSVVPELKDMPPGPEWLRIAIERVFVDTIPPQHNGLQQVLRDFPADVIVADDMIFCALPILLATSPQRPPIVLCGTSMSNWRSS